MNFVQRIALLLHLVGFILGVIAIPAIFLGIYEWDEDFIYTSSLITLIAPSLGWGLRWLISGELVHFIPFSKLVINSLPLQGNFLTALIVIPLLTGGFNFTLERDFAKNSWERSVFGETCQNEDGSPSILGYYDANSEGEVYKEKEKPFYCSDFLIKTSRGYTFCTWNNASNSDNNICRKLAGNPEPRKDYWIYALLTTLITFPIIFYLLTIIRMIINLRERKDQ